MGIARPVRYDLKDSLQAFLKMETNEGVSIELVIKNISILGLACLTEPNETGFFNSGEITPVATIKWKIGDQEFSEHIGRLICQFYSTSGEHRFSTVDQRINVEGPISRIIETDGSIISNTDFELDPDHISMTAFLGSQNTSADIMSKVKNFSIWYEKFKTKDRYQYSMIRSESKGSKSSFRLSEQSKPKNFLIYGSNDYYGMSVNKEVLEASKKALETYGVGSTGSFILTGNSDIHVELSHELAETVGKERAFLYTSGYDANVGFFPCLTSANDLICIDKLSHASIIDASMMCKAQVRYFPHNNMQHLDKLLSDKRDEFLGSMLVSEGIFSMDGVSAPLDALVNMKNKYSSRIFLDEAHSFGVMGNGRGLAYQTGLTDEVDFIMGSLSKTTGASGGFIGCSEEVYRWLKLFSRSAMFTSNMPPSIAAANLKALQVLKENPVLISETHKKTSYFRQAVEDAGFQIPKNLTGFIVPVKIGDYERFGKINQDMISKGIFVTGIVYPAIGRDESRFRFTITSEHSMSDLEYTLESLIKSAKKHGVI